MITVAIMTILGALCYLASVFADYWDKPKLYRLFVSVGGFWTAMGLLTLVLIVGR